MAAPAIPSYLQGNTIKALQQYQSSVPGMFDTSGLENSYNGLASSTYNNGRALAAAAGASYSNRAAQSGASRLGAGFAEAQAMLPIYSQQQQIYSDLASKKLQAQSGQASAMGDTAKAISQLQQARQGMLADYFGNQDRLGLQRQQLAQNQQQFNQDLGYRNQQLAQQASQFGQSNALDKQRLGLQGNESRLKALQLALQAPRQSFSFHTNMGGQGVTAADQASMRAFDDQNLYQSNLRNQLQSYL